MHVQTLGSTIRLSTVVAALVAVALTFATPLALAADKETTALRKRVEQLEEQIVDMQVVIGTLQSLGGRSAGGQGAPAAGNYAGGGGGGTSPQDRARMDGMETQIRALTAQLERLQTSQAGRPVGGAGQRYESYGDNYSSKYPAQAASKPAPRGFGSTTVTQPIEDDAIGGYIDRYDVGGQKPNASRQPPRSDNNQRYAATEPPRQAQPRPRDTVGGNPKALYETAYGYLLQQDYGAAEVAFEDFLQRYPGDGLAGNAQYWLGESHYVRGRYKSAAGAFLKGYQTYAKSTKAPDSLLKLAMSLDRLGQKDAACSSYNELLGRFPKAPTHVKNRAASERRRVGC